MVKKVGKSDDYRSFTVVNVSKTSGCNTKFGSPSKKYGGRYISQKPADAARKAFSELCRTKRIKGVCTLYLEIMETTKGSKNKTYKYKAKRNKLSEPMIMREGTENEYVIEYKPHVQSLKGKLASCPENHNNKTKGRRLKKTAKKTKLSPNNVRRAKNNKSRRKNNV